MRKGIAASSLLFLCLVVPLFALDLDVLPNPDGSVDARFAIDWSYNELLFSGVQLKISSAQEQQEEASLFVGSFTRALDLSVDVFGARVEGQGFDWSLSLNGQYQKSLIREIGYSDSGGTRYFILNDRTIDLYLPRLKASLGWTGDVVGISANTEYAPWFFVKLDQHLTVEPGITKKPFESAQPGYNGLSITGELSLNLPGIMPEILVSWDRVPLAYDALSTQGETTFDSLIQVLKIQGTIKLGFLKILETSPSVTAAWELTSTSLVGLATPIESSRWMFGIGLR